MQEQAEQGKMAHLVDQVTERLSRAVSGKVAFGDAVEKNGTTVIPVAEVRFGFGGGGRKVEEDQPGRASASAGGGARIRPLGFIVLTDRGARFQRIWRAPGWPTVIGLGLVGLIVSRLVAARA